MSDSKIRIKNIGNDVAPIRLIKISNESTLTTDVIAPGDVNSFKNTPEDIRFCLAPLKESVVEVTPADSNVLGEMILAGVIDTKYNNAETFIIKEEINLVETTVDVLFTSRINNQVVGTTERKQHYFLKLGNLDQLEISNVNNINITATKYLAGTGELIGTANTVLPKNKVFVTNTKDIIYPMVIGELEPSTFTDLTVDLDGTRTLFAPTFHRLNLNVTVENNGEISPVNVRGFDTLFTTETANYSFGQITQANNFSIGNNTSVKNDEVTKTITSLFQYKLDETILLKQSFVIEFEHWLIEDSSEVTMSIASVTYDKEQIIANSKLVNGKYYYLLNISNKNLTGIMVEVHADYDGSLYKDFVKTHYVFTFAATITPPPTIPLFALSSRMARVEVKNENTYYYDGYRYLQFKVPVTEPSMVGIFPEISAQNFKVSLVKSTNTLSDISDKAKRAEFFRMTSDSALYDTVINHEADKQVAFAFDKAGEAIFQIAVPSGITGQIYFTLRPVAGNGNLMYYDNDQMQLRGTVDRLPPVGVSGYATIYSNKLPTVEPETTILSYYLFNELLMPGQAIACDAVLNSNAIISLIDERHQYIDILDESGDIVRKPVDYNDIVNISSSHASSYYKVTNSVTGVTNKYQKIIDFTSKEYFDTWIDSYMFVIFRTLDNKLLLINYIKSNGIAIGLNKVVTLSDRMEDMGYTPDKGMKILYCAGKINAYKTVEITKPYTVTYEELTTFESDQTLELNTMVRMIDISGFNTKL